jgi:hypothetical protein
MSAAQWLFVLADGQGNNLCELTTAQGKTLTFKRNTAPEVQFTLSYRDYAAQYLMDALYGSPGVSAGIPRLKCYRQAPNDSARVLRFNGYLAPFPDQCDENTAMLTPVFRGPFSKLLGDGDQRGRFADFGTNYPATDAGQIAKSLIDGKNSDSYTGIATTGTIEATKIRDRAYELANIGQAIMDLSNLLDGFDFDVTPVDQGATMGIFNVYAKQGVDRPASKFEYGTRTLANVRQLSRTIAPPINYVVVTGANGLYSIQTDSTSLGSYGRWPIVVAASDVDEQATLDDKAHALLRPTPVKTVRFTPDLALSPRPWDDFYLGDTVRLFAREGALSENVSPRVNSFTVAVDDSGYETVEVPDPTTPGEEATLRAMLEVEVSAPA